MPKDSIDFEDRKPQAPGSIQATVTMQQHGEEIQREVFEKLMKLASLVKTDSLSQYVESLGYEQVSVDNKFKPTKYTVSFVVTDDVTSNLVKVTLETPINENTFKEKE